MPSVRSSCSNSERWSREKIVEATPWPPARPGASGAVDEVFRVLGDVVVNHMDDILHVDAARGDISRDQHAVAPLLEAGECGASLRLRAVAVNHGGGKTFAVEIFGEAVGSALGAGEDQSSGPSPGKASGAGLPACGRLRLQTPGSAHFPKA